MDVSKNRGIPKSSIFIGFFIIFTIHFGGFPPYFWFNTHIHPHVWGAQNVVAPEGVLGGSQRWWGNGRCGTSGYLRFQVPKLFRLLQRLQYKISIINHRFVSRFFFCVITISYFHPFFFWGGGRLFDCWEMSLIESKSMCVLAKKSVAIWLRHGRYGLYWSLVQGLAVATIELQRIIP